MYYFFLCKVGYKITGQMSCTTLDREVKKVTKVYKRKLLHDKISSSETSPSASADVQKMVRNVCVCSLL